MKVITAVEEYIPSNDEISVFLAGGITNCPDWQKAVIEELSKREDTDNLVIFNPRRENFPIHDPNASNEQITWEFNALENMDIFSMYFSAGESDQPICMYELGRNIVRMQDRFNDWENRIVISVEDGYRRKQDVFIQTYLATNDKNLVNGYVSFEEAIKDHANKIYDTYRSLMYANGFTFGF